MRFVSDDRVMRAAEGLMDARSRVRDAWKVLTNGYELPTSTPHSTKTSASAWPPARVKPKRSRRTATR